MSVRETITLEPIQIFDLVPRGLEFASLVIDGSLEPVITFHSKRPPPYRPQPTLHALRGWPPRPATRLDKPGATFPMVQPLDSRWLVVDASSTNKEISGWVLNMHGRVQSATTFRDAVSDVQVDERQRVWVSRGDQASDNMLEMFELDGTCVSNFELDILAVPIPAS